jgi:hypothetical protein
VKKLGLLAALAMVPAVPDAAAAADPTAIASKTAIASAKRYARSRLGTVSFAVLDQNARLRGLHRTARYPSASVVKAMLLVAVLRRAHGRHLSAGQRALLKPMVTVSDNDAAKAVFATVGNDGLRAVARAAKMRRFSVGWSLFDAQITAADQVRFFLRIDRLVPAAHRRYARRLLSSIVSWQRWGIAAVAHRRGLHAFFKGGWRRGIVHQVALLERGDRRIALAILTSGQPSMAYGQQTLEGIAARVLR